MQGANESYSSVIPQIRLYVQTMHTDNVGKKNPFVFFGAGYKKQKEFEILLKAVKVGLTVTGLIQFEGRAQD